MTDNVYKLRNVLVCLAGLLISLAGLAGAQEADCGGYSRPIVFAELDWDSAQLHNAIAGTILEKGFGCKVDSIPGSTIPMLQGMIRGDIDVTMEIWQDNIPDFWDPAVEAGQVEDLGVNFADASQGWFVPRYVVEGDPERGIEPMAPDLRSVSDLPQYKDLFRDPEQRDKGRFYNCIIGWACEEINNAKLQGYGLVQHFTNFRPGTGVALASSMEGAYLRGEPWFGYYWGPTWVLGKLDMYQLEEPEWSEECWEELTDSNSMPEEACAYPLAEVTIGVNSRFADKVDPQVIEFLRSYKTSNALVSKLLAYMQDNDETPEGAARHFLKTERDMWTEWLPTEVAERVEASLE